MPAFTVARLGPSWLCQPLMFTAGRTAAMLVLFACMAGPAPAHAPRRTGSLDLKAIVQAAQREGGGALAVTQALLRDWPLKGSEFDNPDDEIDGAGVWDAVAAGRIVDVATYCAADVERTRSMYWRMTFQF